MKKNRVILALFIFMLLITTLMISPFALAAEHDHTHGTDTSVSGTNGNSVTGLIIVGVISGLAVTIGASALTMRLRTNAAKLSKMTIMMAAMAVAMMVGLMVGTVSGIWLQSLFYATVIGVTIGVSVGIYAGYAHSWLAALDGMLSGVMSGMMGAMLGVMIMEEHPLLMILFMDAIILIAVIILYQTLTVKDLPSRWIEDQLEHTELQR
ncbi:hypothetical protein ASG89_27865 [Paenibacillus sp. Soil766]|uniref:hypothetical protein n=1 Tax=Paenibacillus sp. Soil766 TaxID=1736404 RepID=UPI00070ACFE4|nr:hypothetical protein [Paenibacillus sp. Soil766]KRE99381.1 hypothetical protein ASG89_27865 [Paenibacillus sp. Soil766]